MSLTMNAAIAKCPRSLFGDKDKGIPPKYRKIFASVAKALLNDAGEKFDEATVDLVAAYVNPSSMQRSVAGYRETLTGKFDRATGKYLAVEEKQPKKERGKPRPKMKTKGEDDLGLGDSRRVKSAKKLKALAKGGKKAEAKAKDALTSPPAKKTPAKPPGKAAKAPKSDGAAGTKLDAIAAARASLAAKKAAKAKKAGKTKAAEETVEI